MDDRVGTVESVVVNVAFWRDRSVFITGHTGFKGSWLSIWLQEAGARVSMGCQNPACSKAISCPSPLGFSVKPVTTGPLRASAP